MKEKIGYFFSDKYDLVKHFNRVHYSLTNDNIIRIEKNTVRCSIETEDIIYYFLIANDYARGYKLNHVYYEHSIDIETLYSIVVPTCRDGRVLPFRLDDNNMGDILMEDIQDMIGDREIQVGIRTRIDYFPVEIDDITVTDHTVYINIVGKAFVPMERKDV